MKKELSLEGDYKGYSYMIYEPSKLELGNSHRFVAQTTVCFALETTKLGGGLIFLNVHPYLGKIPILTNMFQMG